MDYSCLFVKIFSSPFLSGFQQGIRHTADMHGVTIDYNYMDIIAEPAKGRVVGLWVSYAKDSRIPGWLWNRFLVSRQRVRKRRTWVVRKSVLIYVCVPLLPCAHRLSRSFSCEMNLRYGRESPCDIAPENADCCCCDKRAIVVLYAHEREAKQKTKVHP